MADENQPSSLSWTDRDTAALLSVNIPLQSRLSRSSKPRVRRNVRPQGVQCTQLSHDALPLVKSSHQLYGRCKGGTIDSPRKVVKKLCLGPEWRITEWDRAKSAHLRKATHISTPAGIVSDEVAIPSGALLNAKSVEQRHDNEDDDGHDTGRQSDWEDVPDDLDSDVECGDGPDLAVSEHHCETMRTLLGALKDISAIDGTSGDSLIYNLRSPDDREDPESTRSSNISSSSSHRTPNDDKAILEAFISRAKSNPRLSATAKRESIENKRDSGAVRMAMTSPARMHILSALDPNSPLPDKTLPSVDQTALQTTGSNSEENRIGETPKTARRSARSKARTQQIEDKPSQTEPARISFRGSARNGPILQTESRNLGIITRSNTKKNTAEAVSVRKRLSMLAHDPAGDAYDTDGEDVKKCDAKAVGWNSTLVFFQDGTSLVDDGRDGGGETKAAVVEPASPAVTTRARRARARQEAGRQTEASTEAPVDSGPQGHDGENVETTSTQGSGGQVAIPASEEAQNAEVLHTPKPRVRGRSRIATRIATPAAGLSSRAGAKSGAAPAPFTMSTRERGKQSRRRTPTVTAPGLSTARKIDFQDESQGAMPETAIEQTAVVGPSTARERGQRSSPARKAALQALSTSTRADTIAAGLTSPAKRRGPRSVDFRGVSTGDKTAGPATVRSLQSPAKRPNRRLDGIDADGDGLGSGSMSGPGSVSDGASLMPRVIPVLSSLQSPAKRRARA